MLINLVQVLLPGGPTTYGRDALADGMTLAQKIVANYGLTQAGVTMYASPAVPAAGVRSNYEVSVEQIDEDVVGQGLEGGMYQASDKTIGKLKMSSQELLREAYNKDLVRLYIDLPLFEVGLTSRRAVKAESCVRA